MKAKQRSLKVSLKITINPYFDIPVYTIPICFFLFKKPKLKFLRLGMLFLFLPVVTGSLIGCPMGFLRTIDKYGKLSYKFCFNLFKKMLKIFDNLFPIIFKEFFNSSQMNVIFNSKKRRSPTTTLGRATQFPTHWPSALATLTMETWKWRFDSRKRKLI